VTVNYIEEYNAKIQSGEIVAPRRVKAVYARLAAACLETDGQYVLMKPARPGPLHL